MEEFEPWAEKYRPTKIDDCILPERLKSQAKEIISSGQLQSTIMIGQSGLGKTTLARVLVAEMNADLLFINASLKTGIDTIRTKVDQFATSVSFTGSKKVTILDEADGLSAESQNSLKGLIEAYSKNHSIIFTGNSKQKIIDAIYSRCNSITFDVSKDEKVSMKKAFVQRAFHILDLENVKYDKLAVAEFVSKKLPDFRYVLNTLQGYSQGGSIDAGILMKLDEVVFDELIEILKAKKFNDMRKWVGEHSDIQSSIIFRMFYDKMKGLCEPISMLELLDVTMTYMKSDYFVVDKEINMAAYLASIMTNPAIKWK